MRKVIKIDQQTGLFIEDVLLADNEEIPSDCVETLCPDGFHHPKWNGNQWVEGGVAPAKTKAEIIADLKAQLTATDYKIIKCSECSLAGEDLPYDIAALHSERQAIRDQINALEMS